MASRWKPVGSIIPSGTQRSANNSAFVQPLQSVPTGVTQPFPARLVVPPFGWSGPWHPLFKSGLFSQPGLINVEIAPKNYRAIPTRLNIKFDVVEPFTIPLTYGKLKSFVEVERYIKKQESAWYLTFTLCPFTARWVNGIVGRTSRVPVFYPLDPKYAPAPVPKVYDVMLASSKAAAMFLKPALAVIKHFHYVLLKKSTEGDPEPPTHPSPIAHEQKLLLYAKSKC
eukprot:EG_transcript_29194